MTCLYAFVVMRYKVKEFFFLGRIFGGKKKVAYSVHVKHRPIINICSKRTLNIFCLFVYMLLSTLYKKIMIIKKEIILYEFECR